MCRLTNTTTNSSSRTLALAGQHRWVEYAGDKSFYQVDASFVPPEWHGWLHSVTAEVPTKVSETG
jgi:NADH:ubiquinone oxidoreductase subunit